MIYTGEKNIREAPMSFPSPKEFYESFKNDSEAAKRASYKTGQELGQSFQQKLNAWGNDLETVAKVLNEFQTTVQGNPNAKVEGNTVTMRCTGFCPIMRAALTLNIPWSWLDTSFAWPMIQGIASHVMPGIRLRLPSAKSRGDDSCIYVFEK